MLSFTTLSLAKTRGTTRRLFLHKHMKNEKKMKEKKEKRKERREKRLSYTTLSLMKNIDTRRGSETLWHVIR